MNQRDPGVDRVRPAAEPAKHRSGMRSVGWFAQNLLVQQDDRIGAENERTGMPRRNRLRFLSGHPPDEGLGSGVPIEPLLDIGRVDNKRQPEISQKLSPPGRGRC